MPRIIFQRSMQNPADSFVFSRLLKPDKLEGRFKVEIL